MPFAGRKHHGDCRFGGTIANRTCLCRGAACRSRHNAADTNRLPLKWYAPIASVRFFGSRYGTAVPSRDCTPRALPRASRSGRHVGLRPPRNDNLGGYYCFIVNLYQSSVQRRERHAAPLQRMAGRLAKLSAFHFQLSIFHSRLPLRCNSPTNKTQAPLRVQRGRRLSKNLSSRKFRREEKCERKPSGCPFAFHHPPQRQNCKIILQNSILQFWKAAWRKSPKGLF